MALQCREQEILDAMEGFGRVIDVKLFLFAWEAGLYVNGKAWRLNRDESRYLQLQQKTGFRPASSFGSNAAPALKIGRFSPKLHDLEGFGKLCEFCNRTP